jgi:peptidyl-prolyl cis-trans isomerase A (cyclophilin A)
MRKQFGTLLLIFTAAIAGAAQSSTGAQTAPAAKPAPAAHPASTEPTAIINTMAGKLTCTLFPDKAPIGVANFIGLASGTKDWKNPANGSTKHGVPLYDGTVFHRVIPNFMIQGGDPAGTGSGADPVPPFKNEVSPDLKFDRPGRLAYANTGQINSNSTQFFITEDVEHSQHLSGGYTIFGQCDDAAVELVKQIARMARDPSTDKPFRPVKIVHITIVKAGAAKPATAPVKKPAAAAAPKAPSN